MMDDTQELIADATSTGSRLLRLAVSRRSRVAQDVISIRLEDPQGDPLPEWSPGAHIDVHIDGYIRQYSLCDLEPSPRSWRIAILREDDGRGGSRAVHEKAIEGTELVVSRPRNRFELVASPRYLFVAGGIGITPILSMIGEAERSNAKWHLIYGGRSLKTMAFLDELSCFGDRVAIIPEDTDGRPEFERVLRQVGADTKIYACGPTGMLDAVIQAAEHWPKGSLHFERFTGDEIDTSADVGFEVEFAASKLMAYVPPGRSILEVAKELGLEPEHSCQEGICGTCVAPVLSGTPEHRDVVLSEEEQRQSMCLCVSRSANGGRLVLDL